MKQVRINYRKTAENIKRKMGIQKISKKELMQMLELKTYFRINRILKGETLPSLKETLIMCDLFDARANEIIDYCILEK